MLSNFKKLLLSAGEIYIKVKSRPSASITAVRGLMKDDTIKIDIKAKAENNKANNELAGFLAKEFEIPEKNVKIIKGVNIRRKVIKIVKKF